MISEYLRQILSARYGKDVRQSIHDSIKELNEVAVTAQGSATVNAQTAITKANEALAASQAAIESAKQAKAYADNAQAVAGVTVATQDTAGLVKGGENHIALDGTLELVVKTTETSMPNSRKGRVEVVEIGGVSKQDNIPSPELIQEVKKSVVSGIKTHGKNFLKNTQEEEIVLNGGTFTVNDDGSVTVNGTFTADTNYNIVNENVPMRDGLYTNLIKLSGEFNGTITHIAFDKQYIGGVVRTMGNASPLNSTLKYNRYRMSITSGTVCNNLVVGFMVAEDASTYEPYKESSFTFSNPIDLYGIGDVQDVIVRKDGVFGVEQKYGTTDLTGATWAKNEATKYYTSLDDEKYKRNNSATIMCDRLVSGNGSGNGVSINNYGKIRINIVTEDDTVESVTEAMNGAVVVAELAEYIFTPLPIADQIALNSLATFDGATYIEFDSEVQPTFKGNYGASLVGGAALEGLLIARNNELRITALEA